MTRIFIVLALLLVAEPAFPQDVSDQIFHALTPTYAGLAAWDARTTLDCVDRFAWCSEGNVTGLKQVSDRVGIKGAMATKLAIHGGIIMGLTLVRQKWPSQKPWINGALGILSAFQLYVNIKNDQTIQKARGL
jgi:hypothetical protein